MKRTTLNLIPDVPNPSPDYYCTWQTQLYATCDGKPQKQRESICERSLFAQEKPYGWAYFYEPARQELLFVMDDSWDVPLSGDSSYYGSLILNEEKFPEAVRSARGLDIKSTEMDENAQALKNLVDRMKALGWKGLGGWVCAQEAQCFSDGCTEEQYWMKRMKQAEQSGFSYWKVDWGAKCEDTAFRKRMTDLGKQYAADLVIEHAKKKEILPNCDVFRTYDVPAIMSIPMTMQKLAVLLSDIMTKQDGNESLSDDVKMQEGRMKLINCEDEAYIAAAGGFTMGIMRHPYQGAFVNGKPDMAFPESHRNLKTKIYEVVRAARWHRAAPAFDAFYGTVTVEKQQLCDTWKLENPEAEVEDWWLREPALIADMEEDRIKQYAPAQIARNCEAPYVEADENGMVPYMVSSRNPNGVFSIATLGRTTERNYKIPHCNVTVDISDAKLLGVFGEYKNLTVKRCGATVQSIFMQDIAGECAYDVTDEIQIKGDTCVIPGQLIQQIGTFAQPASDTSEPGVVIYFRCKENNAE